MPFEFNKLFEITISFDYWYRLLALGDPVKVAWQLLKDFWVILLIVGAYFLVDYLFRMWMDWRQSKYVAKWEFTTLAIDIPKNNEQSPKAVEYIFSQLAGIHSNPNFIEKYWDGKVQEYLSFELVSDGGYLQFYVWTNIKFRDLVEAAVYAQYPDAIITEVEDYAQKYKNVKFPSQEYGLWGTEFMFVKDTAYPIKTYPSFEHTLSGELKDPMAGMLEILSRFGPGEQGWVQFVTTPISEAWAKKASSAIDKLIGKKEIPKKTMFDKIIDVPLKALSMFVDLILPGEPSEEKKEDEFNLQKLTPGEQDSLKSMQMKLSKIAYSTMFRYVYLGPKEIHSKPRGVNGFIGAVKQFNTVDLNALKPNGKTTTKIDYFMVKSRIAQRQNGMLSRYIGRANGDFPIILNTEELASLYHFPVMTVKAPLLSTAQAKRGEAPGGLPAGAMGIPAEVPVEAVVEKNTQPEKVTDKEHIMRGASDIVDWGIPEELMMGDEQLEKKVNPPSSEITEDNPSSLKTTEDKEEKEEILEFQKPQTIEQLKNSEITTEVNLPSLKTTEDKKEKKTGGTGGGVPPNLPFVED